MRAEAPVSDDPGRDASTAGMKAGGHYDAHSEYQRRVIEGGDRTIRSLASELDLAALAGPLTIADYGAGTGATSVHAVRTALEALRERQPDRPAVVIHNDVPTNDFSQLFRNVAGADGYLPRDGGSTFAMAAAGSFFTQVVPSASVHLGMCSNAAHWFREQPSVELPDGIYFSEASGAARAQLADQAARDWQAFLEARGRELAPGGRLLVQGIATAGKAGEAVQVSAGRLLRVMGEVASQLVADGLLDREVLASYVFPVYCRTVAESTAPLRDQGPLAGTFGVISQEIDAVPNPYWEQFERDRDPRAYATTYVEFVRAFAESTMSAHLFEPGAVGIEPSALADEYFSRLREATVVAPAEGRYEAWVLRLALARI